jgi:Repeat of unknown function (DUF5648)
MKPKFKLINVSLASITSFLTCTSVLAGSGPLTPLYETYYGGYTDTFLTTSAQERAVAVNQYGYQDLGIVGYVLSNSGLSQDFNLGAIDSLLAFARFYKGAPQIEHFYTTSFSEQSALLGFGYVTEGKESFLFTSKLAPNIVPLIRLAKYNGSNGDLVHKWTTDEATVTNLATQGWTSDGIAGYVWKPSSKTEGLEGVVKLGTSNSVGILTYGFCTLPPINASSGGCDIRTGYGYQCPENVDIYINDVFRGTYNSSLTARGLSGTSYGCSAGAIEKPFPGSPSLKIRIERSGFVGAYSYLGTFGATVKVFNSVPPGSGTFYLSP